MLLLLNPLALFTPAVSLSEPTLLEPRLFRQVRAAALLLSRPFPLNRPLLFAPKLFPTPTPLLAPGRMPGFTAPEAGLFPAAVPTLLPVAPPVVAVFPPTPVVPARPA